MSEHKIFGGEVTVDLSRRNLKQHVIREGLEQAVPEHVSFAPVTKRLFDDCHLLIGLTRSMTFAESLSPPAAQLQDFWIFASRSADYRAIWDRFISDLDMGILNAWSDTINAEFAADEKLAAPMELQLPDDQLTDEQRKKKKPTSKRSTPKSASPSPD